MLNYSYFIQVFVFTTNHHLNGHKSNRSATICTGPGVSYRNYLGTCLFVWEPMVNTAHGYVILGGSSWLLT